MSWYMVLHTERLSTGYWGRSTQLDALNTEGDYLSNLSISLLNEGYATGLTCQAYKGSSSRNLKSLYSKGTFFADALITK